MLFNTFTAILILSRLTVAVTDNTVYYRAASYSCQGRCGANLDNTKLCQCNSHCVRFGDCCPDYNSLCVGGSTDTGHCASISTSGSCSSLAQVSEALWCNDLNRLPNSAYSLNYQAKVPDNSNVDQSSYRLFSNVDKNFLSGRTYRTFLTLMDNYEPVKGVMEHVSYQERQEEEDFLDAILNTSVMNTLLSYLTCEGIVTTQAELKSTLRRIWFDLYPRSGGSATPDTNGFEHVLVGEYKSSTSVNGFHNWLSFYEKEESGELDYYGYVSRDLNGPLIGAAFNWNGRMKPLGSFFIGVSPEFDIAIYSLCFLTNANNNCPISLNGKQYDIMTYSKDDHIATAFAST